MSEDRTQAPSLRRRQEAKAKGVVARSPELTAAVVLLTSVALLGMWGESLASAFADLIRAPLIHSESWNAEPGAVVAMFRAAAFRVVMPLFAILSGVLIAAIAAHQAQVGGLWASQLIAPDVSRLWTSSGADWSTRGTRGGWGIAKTLLLAVVAIWAIRSEWMLLQTLAERATHHLASASATAIRRIAFALGVATLALGLIDYLMARRRVELALQTTPEESREEAKSVDGDPAVRARRLRLAKSWRADPGEMLKDAIIVLTGPGGLAVVLAGEGPPGKVTVKGSARGASGSILKKSASRAGLKLVNAPILASHFATASARTQALSAALRQELAELWPSCDTETTAHTAS